MVDKHAKQLLRTKVKEILRTVATEAMERQSKRIFDVITKNAHYLAAERISIFLSMKGEVDTLPLLMDMFQRRKTVYIPRYVEGKPLMDMVRLKSMEDYEGLPLTKWRIKQPALDEMREDALESGGLDLVLVPGVAFTKKGHRLGRGGGYYDRYLRTACEIKTPYTIGLCFKEQIFDEVPCDDHDYLVNEVITEQ